MLDVIAIFIVVVALVIFTGMAYRILTTVKRESAVFAEFEQSTSVGYCALLFPLGPVIMLLIGMRAPLIGILLSAGCYVPGLVLARRATAAFDRAGTDRVQNANGAMWQALGAAIAGLAFAAVALVFVLAVGSLRGPTDA
jgi:hypothetical protein